MQKLEGHVVLNVQNHYKDIAHMIEKKMKKILYCVRTDFIRSPNLVGEFKGNILNKAKEDYKVFLFLI